MNPERNRGRIKNMYYLVYPINLLVTIGNALVPPCVRVLFRTG